MGKLLNFFIIIALQWSSIAHAMNYPKNEEMQKSTVEFFKKFNNWDKQYYMAQGKIALMLDWNVYFTLNEEAANAWQGLTECYKSNEEALSAYMSGASECPIAKTLISQLHNNLYNFVASSHFRWNYLKWQLSRDLISDVRNNFPSHPLFHFAVFALLAKADADFWDPGHEELTKMISTENPSTSENLGVRTFANLNILYALTPSNLECSNPIKQATQVVYESSKEINSFQFLYGTYDGFTYANFSKCEKNSSISINSLLQLEKMYRE